MREVVKDKGRIEHMMSAIANVEEFTKGKLFKMICHC